VGEKKEFASKEKGRGGERNSGHFSRLSTTRRTGARVVSSRGRVRGGGIKKRVK